MPAAAARPAACKVRQIDRRREARSRAAARLDAGHPPDRAARQGGAPALHRGRLRHRPRILSLRAGRPRDRRASPSWPRPKAAWTSRRSRTRRPEKILSFSVDPATGFMPHHGRRVAQALGFGRELAKQAESVLPKLYAGVRRQGHEPARDQSAGRHQGGRADLPRRQDRLRRQRALPPSRHRGAARPRPRRTPRRSRPRNTISTTSRSTAPSAAWSTAPASPWRPWTSSSSTARRRPTSSTSAAAPPRRRSRRRSRSSPPTPT